MSKKKQYKFTKILDKYEFEIGFIVIVIVATTGYFLYTM